MVDEFQKSTIILHFEKIVPIFRYCANSFFLLLFIIPISVACEFFLCQIKKFLRFTFSHIKRDDTLSSL